MGLSNAQYKALITEYEKTRDANQYLSEQRFEEVYKVCPEIRDLDSSVGSRSSAAIRALLSGDDDAGARLHEELQAVAAKRRALLLSAGFAEDYLDPIYDCPECKDTGYTTDENNLRHKCSCFVRKEIAFLYSQSNIQSKLEDENFDTLSYDYYKEEDLDRFTAAVELCKGFVQNFEQHYANLFFYGTVGTGKSFLSGCVAKELLKSGHSVIYFSSVALFEKLARYSFDYKEKEYLQSFYDDIYNCDLLIIDDLGTELTNNFVASQLFSCLNERNLRKKATVISTNLSLAEIRDRYSDRIFSRITSSFELCKITGQDIRIQKKRLASAK